MSKSMWIPSNFSVRGGKLEKILKFDLYLRAYGRSGYLTD